MTKRKPKTWVRWDDDQDTRLETLLAGGLSHRQIAKIMGRGLDSIRSRIKALGLPAPARDDIWPDEQMDFLITHVGRRGWSYRRIAEAMPGEPVRSASACQNKARRLDLVEPTRARTQRIPDDTRKRCLVLAMQDLSGPEIAERLGVSPAWVNRTINASPYHAQRYREREGIRRSYAMEQRHRRQKENAA